MNQAIPSPVEVSNTPALILVLIQLALVIFLAVAVTIYFKFVVKLQWSTSSCFAVILITIIVIFGIRLGLFGHYVVGGPALFFPAFVCIIILLVKFFQLLFSSVAAQPAVNPQERSRILKLVEDGKINADEGKELLDAMGKSSALRGEEKFTRVDLAILAGVGLVILGFFLPWNYVRLPNMHIPGIEVFDTNSAYQAGYNAAAIGWTIFIIALASAIPVFVTPRNLLYKISMLQIFLVVIGVILVISVLVQVGEHLGVGLILCLAGFLTAFFASLAKFKSLAA